MISFQDAFTNSALDVVLADTSIAFPYDHDIQGDDWLTALQSPGTERSVAFFGGCAGKKLRSTHPAIPRRKAGLLSHHPSYGFQRRHRYAQFYG